MKITLTTSLVNVFEKKLSQFQRKFSKYGQGQLIYTKSEPYIQEERGEHYGYEMVDIEVEGQYKVGDYEFVASLDFDQNTRMNLVKKAPDTADIPSMYITRCECDHCHSRKSSRQHTVLLRNTITGEFVQVGKTCLHDYLGKDIGNYAAFLGMFTDLEQYMDEVCSKASVTGARRAYEVEEVLTQAVVDARVRGYVSRAAVQAWYEKNDLEGEYDLGCPFTTTASRICTMFAEIRDDHGNLVVPEYKEITEEDKQQVVDVIAYVNEHRDDSDYMRNLHILISSKWTEFNNVGLVVSAVGSYLRETKKREEQAAISEEDKSTFVGNVGDKIEVTAKPECIFSTETQYGVYHIYKFMMDKNVIIWKTSKALSTEKEVTIKATIKGHNEFRGVKQTEVTRARIVA